MQSLSAGEAQRPAANQLAQAIRAARVSRQKGLHLEAVRHYRTACGLAPDDAALHLALAVELLALKRVAPALAAVENALRQQPDLDPKPLQQAVGRLAQKGEAETASRFYRKAVELFPRSANLRRATAMLLHRAGHTAEALAHCEALLGLQPDDPAAHALQTGLLLDQGQVEVAEARLGEARRRFPEHGEIAALYSEALRRRGQLEEALHHAKAAVTLKPEVPRHHIGLALAQRALGRTEAAEHSLSQASARLPNSVPLLQAWADMRALLGDKQGALDTLRQALELAPDQAPLLRRRGQWLLAAERTAEAVQALQRAAELAPKDASCHRHLAFALERKGQVLEASRAAEQAAALAPGDPTGHAIAAGLLARAGDREAAEKAFRRGLALRSKPLPERLTDGLAALWQKAPAASVGRRKLNWAWRQARDLHPDREAWETAAKWSYLSDRLILDWLECRADRLDELRRLLLPADWSSVRQALQRGHGALLVGAHLGPVFTAPIFAHDSGLPHRWLASRPPLSLVPFSQTLISTTESRVQVAKSMLRALQKGEVVTLPADGRIGHMATFELKGAMLELPLCVPRLIWDQKCPAFWMDYTWVGETIAVTFESCPEPLPKETPEDWTARWFDFYLGRIERTLCGDPRNLKLGGGFWRALS